MNTESDLFQSLVGIAAQRSYGADEVLLREGDVCENLFFIETGRVKEYSTYEGKEFIIAFRQSGEFLGDVSFSPFINRFSSRAVEPTVCQVIERRKAFEIAAESPAHLLASNEVVRQRNEEITELVKLLALKPVYERVRVLLLEGMKNAEPPVLIDGAVNFQVIANQVGASRDMISKIFKDLRYGGYVEVSDIGIYILKPLPERY